MKREALVACRKVRPLRHASVRRRLRIAKTRDRERQCRCMALSVRAVLVVRALQSNQCITAVLVRFTVVLALQAQLQLSGCAQPSRAATCRSDANVRRRRRSRADNCDAQTPGHATTRRLDRRGGATTSPHSQAFQADYARLLAAPQFQAGRGARRRAGGARAGRRVRLGRVYAGAGGATGASHDRRPRRIV